MVFRYLVGNLLRETAEGALREAADEAGKSFGGKEDAQGDAASAPPVHCPVVVAMALPAETGGLVDWLADVKTLAGAGYTERIGTWKGRTISVVETGLGRQRAEQALGEVIQTRRPEWVLSAGFAGGLQDEMRRGHFLMADAVLLAREKLPADDAPQQLSIGLTMDKEALAASPGVHVGRLLTVGRLIRGAEEKRQLGQTYDALACEMETFAVAHVCQREKVRFLSVRIISDTVEEELPNEIEKLLDQQTTAAKLGAAAAALWNRPSAAKDLWKLKEDALSASDRLAKFLTGVIAQLPIQEVKLPADESDADAKKEAGAGDSSSQQD